ncbi:MAG: D-alanine--D-alanine ligase [Paludibacteraceae bacterium]|nr:D-alanine--D-alanine ligase [Paludibacteraceae bacterium]
MKKNIAIVAGGDSSEVVVSLKSAAGLYSFMDKDRYNLFIITISGRTWQVEWSEKEKINIDRNDFSFTRDGQKTTFDFAYITIHGTPGENGILQGYFELIGLPYSCCDVLSAAITFNKYTCNQYLKGFGINVSESIVLRQGQSIETKEVSNKIAYPCFVKPNVGGSSFGVTKVKSDSELQPAILKAFAEGSEVMIEAFMQGTEITCGMYKISEKTVVFPVTEVVPENEFFDFDAKYKGQVQEITPARISNELTLKVQAITTDIYNILGCKGIVRIDYIISEGDIINLLEVNTTPGMTPTSFIPQQVKAAGLDIKDVMTEIIENEILNKTAI